MIEYRFININLYSYCSLTRNEENYEFLVHVVANYTYSKEGSVMHPYPFV